MWRDATMANDSEVIAEYVGDPVFRITHGTITWASPSVTRQFGGTHSQWLGMTWGDRVHPDDLPTFLEATSPVGGGRAARFRVRMLGLEKARHWVDMTVTPTAEPGVWVVSVHLVDEDVAREQSLKRLAGSDSLTGLSNRRDFLMRLAAILSKRRKGQLTGLLFCDLDNLKSINDRAGHAAGDTVISTVAQRIQHLVRRDDICARFGGDEFVIVLVGLHNLDDALGIAEKIRLAATIPVAVTDGQTLSPSLSIGVTLARDGEDVSDLVARADAAMYQAKDSGRNAVAAL